MTGTTTQLVGTVTASTGREVTSATIDAGDGVARPITITGTTWRVTVPLPASLEATRTVTLSALDASSQTTSTSFTLNIDTLGPRTTLSQPAMGVVVGAMTILQGTVTDPAMPIMLVTVDVGSGPQMATVAAGGTWQVNTSFPANLNRITRQVTIAAIDSLGNQSTQTAQVIVDTQGPVLVVTSPSSTTVVGASTTFTGTATDSSGPVTGMTLDIGTGALPVTIQANGAWSLAVTFPPNLDRVTRTATLRAQDTLGNVTQTAVQVLVDTQGPVLAFTAPNAMQRLGTPRTQTVTGTVSDGSGVSGVVMNCADAGGNRTATVSNGSWNVSWPLPSADNTNFTCAATATDSLANQTVVTRSFFVDTVGPVITITAPSVDALLGGPASTVQVVATVTDGSNQLISVQFVLGAVSQPATGAGTTYSSTFTLPGADYVATNITAVAQDVAFNTTSIVQRVFIDKLAPTVNFTTPTAGQVFNGSSFNATNDVTMTWSVTDRDPLAGSASFHGSPVASSTRSATVTTLPSDNGVNYSRTVVVTDRAGNTASATRSFSVDRVAPAVVSMTPANDSRMNDPRVASVSFSEAMSTSQHALFNVGGGVWNQTQTVWTSSTLPGSSVFLPLLNLGLTDLAGNPPTTAVSWRFHTAPVLPASGSLIATNVRAFDAVSDLDGRPTIAVAFFGDATASTFTLDGSNGSFLENENGLFLPSGDYRDIHVQVHSVVGTSLNPVRTRSINGYRQFGPPLNTRIADRRLSIDGTPFDPSGLPIVTPPIEALDGMSEVGNIVGQTYSRAPITRSLAYTPEKVIAGLQQWAAFSYTGAALAISHRQCGNNNLQGGQRECGFQEGLISDSVGPSVLQSVSGAVSNSGCFIYSYDAASGRRARAFGSPSSYAGSVTGLSFTSVAAPGAGFTVTRRQAGGHYGAWETGFNTVQVSRTTTPTTCTNASLATNWTSIGTVVIGTGAQLRVVELGNRPAVLYLQSNELRIAYP